MWCDLQRTEASLPCSLQLLVTYLGPWSKKVEACILAAVISISGLRAGCSCRALVAVQNCSSGPPFRVGRGVGLCQVASRYGYLGSRGLDPQPTAGGYGHRPAPGLAAWL